MGKVPKKERFIELLKKYLATIVIGILIPFFSAIGSLFELDQKGKIYLLVGLIYFTFVVMLPFDYLRRMRKRLRQLERKLGSMDLDIRKQRTLENLVIYQALIMNEFFRVDKIEFEDTIIGSNVRRKVIWSGVNKNPKRKSAKEFRGLLASEASLDLIEMKSKDELRNEELSPRRIYPREEEKHGDWAVYEIRFQPIGYNEWAMFSHNNVFKGEITQNPDFISYLTGHFKRGVDVLEGVIRFEEKPLSWAAKSVEKIRPKIKFYEMEEELVLSRRRDSEGFYRLTFRLENPPPLFLIEFYLK
jgi:hypothetical protein